MKQDNEIRDHETNGTRIKMYERCKETGALLRIIEHTQTIRHISDLKEESYEKEMPLFEPEFGQVHFPRA